MSLKNPNALSKYPRALQECCIAMAGRYSVKHASEYYDVPEVTIGKWIKKYATMSPKKQHKKTDANPYRMSQYDLERRIKLSDKLFAELEFTLEVTKLRSGGAVPADQLNKIIYSFQALVNVRRLEEGAHTELIRAKADPIDAFRESAEAIAADQRHVTSIRERASLNTGS